MDSIAEIKITKQDKQLLDNLVKVLARAKIELEGVEILAAGDSMRWLSRFQRQIEEYKPEEPIANLVMDKSIKNPTKIKK